MLGLEEGRLVLNAASLRGFSIIELMIALTIMGVLIALGMPSLGSYVQTARLGSMAKGFYTGVQMARTEAIRLNQPVDFVLTNTAVVPNIQTLAVANTSGRNWVVRYTDAAAAVQLVEAKSVLEGGGAGPAMTATSSSSVITFDSLGRNAANRADSINIANPAAGLCDPAGPVRCWRVAVSAGGQVRLCQPAANAASAGDTRGC